MRSARLLAGALALLAVVAGILAACGFGGDGVATNPSPSATLVGPTPLPSSPTATAPEPTFSPAPSPTAGTASPPATVSPWATPPTVALPDGLLPAGSVITMTGDGVRIRDEPSLNAEIIGTTMAGDAAYVEDSILAGPVRADGYEWYQVAYAGGDDVWPWQDLAPDGYVTGWVAAGSDTERFVDLAGVSCPTDDVTLRMLALELTPWERLVCLHAAPFVVEGTYGCDGCGGVTPGASPTWLADVTQHAPIAGQYRYYPFIRVAVPPGTETPQDRDIVRATLHVDDPAANTCTFTPDPQGTTPTLDYDSEAVHIFCRERLVLGAFEVIGTDDFGR